MADTRDFLIGVLVGSAIGAAAALLYAPAPGTETRQMIKDKAGEAKEKTTQIASQAKERVGEVTHNAQVKVDELKHTTQAKVDELKSTTQAKVDELKSMTQTKVGELSTQAHSAIDRGKELVDRQKEAVVSAVEAGRQAYMEKQNELQQDVAEDTQAIAPA